MYGGGCYRAVAAVVGGERFSSSSGVTGMSGEPLTCWNLLSAPALARALALALAQQQQRIQQQGTVVVVMVLLLPVVASGVCL